MLCVTIITMMKVIAAALMAAALMAAANTPAARTAADTDERAGMIFTDRVLAFAGSVIKK